MSDGNDDAGAVIAARAPAKINLTLAVARRRGADGYHELRGVFARLDLADDLTVLATGAPATGAGDTLHVAAGSIARDHPADLILRAVQLVRDRVRGPLPRLTIGVEKRIPIAAGLAGGSSDGVAALRLVAKAWGLEIPPQELADLALELGADAPFFLGTSPVALIGGRGERVQPLSAGIAGAGILLVVAGGKPSTGDVFAAHEAQLAPGEDVSAAGAATDHLADELHRGLTAEGLVALSRRLRDANDLYPAAARLMPHLGSVREAIEADLHAPALLSGAGSTLFVIYPSAEAAGDAAQRLERTLGPRNAFPTVIATAIATY